MDKLQLRGICQCCGREQAVVSGRMSKHGYTVEHGWFSGVCSGRNYAPMQVDRSHADRTIKAIRDDADDLIVKGTAYECYEIDPKVVDTHRRDPKTRQPITIPWADAEPWQQERARRDLVMKLFHRARQGRAIANDLEKLANTYHGQPLKEVVILDDVGPAPINPGDIKTLHGRTVKAAYTEKGRVYFRLENSDNNRMGWIGVAAWRKLPVS